MNSDSVYELRVLDGPQKGARLPLPRKHALVLGARWDSDVVLRGAGVGERSLCLSFEDGRIALRVLQGDAQVGAQRMQVNQSIDLALYTPVQVGDVCLAVGERGERSEQAESQWSTLWDSLSAPAALEPVARAPWGGLAGALGRRLHRPQWWPRFLLLAGSGLAAVSVSALAIAVVVDPGQVPPQQTASDTQRFLQEAGYPGLVVRAQPDGSLVLSGYLDSAAQRPQVERLLAAVPAPVRWSAWSNDQVAASVREVYRVNGVSAEVEATGPGRVRVRTREADPERPAALAAVARRDVVGLESVQTVNTPPPRTPAGQPVITDAGKRIASVVPGDAPYVVTADGTRYFAGALLPTGHRIAAIEAHRVLLELDGTVVSLQF